MGALTGSTAKKQFKMAQAAQEGQAARLEAEAAKVAKVEAGQKQAAERGGGMLAYVDERLRKTLGS